MTSTLTKLIIDGISAHSTLLDSYVVLHAAFVSALHKLVGIEFGGSKPVMSNCRRTDGVSTAAHFVQETITTYEKHYSELTDSSIEEGHTEGKERGKECSNLIILISELYNFQVISCVLLFDVVRTLLEGRLTEMDVELLLKILRSRSRPFLSRRMLTVVRLGPTVATGRPTCLEGHCASCSRQSCRAERRKQVRFRIFYTVSVLNSM